ncbi:hypothetical protein MXB_3247, partial [Myxobolus squamalis]
SNINEHFLLLTVKLFYIRPICFRHLKANELQNITKKIIDLEINNEKSLRSHAVSINMALIKIECLQEIAYFLSKVGRVFQNLNFLVNFVIDCLLFMIDIPDKNSSVSLKALRNLKT